MSFWDQLPEAECPCAGKRQQGVTPLGEQAKLLSDVQRQSCLLPHPRKLLPSMSPLSLYIAFLT